ncbi:hypothetical protein HanPI659440_Chr03g0103011 [Helianthus annuus]|nr:hypothetical protein HanPI659440_Chr03g0103011 [Helianthus annuus]
MAATSDEALDSLLSDFDQIHTDFIKQTFDIQTLQSSRKSEIQRREAVEFTLNTLKSENERVMKLYTGSISKLANQLERRNDCQSLKEELKRVNDEHTKKENVSDYMTINMTETVTLLKPCALSQSILLLFYSNAI